MANDETTTFDLSIEYCTGCRWLLRSLWLTQEVFTTFRQSSKLHSITLLPSRPPAPGGIFRLQLEKTVSPPQPLSHLVLWDRNQEGGFPEAKQVKQRLRDVLEPTQDLGHSDRRLAEQGNGNGNDEAPEEDWRIWQTRQDEHDKEKEDTSTKEPLFVEETTTTTTTREAPTQTTRVEIGFRVSGEQGLDSYYLATAIFHAQAILDSSILQENQKEENNFVVTLKPLWKHNNSEDYTIAIRETENDSVSLWSQQKDNKKEEMATLPHVETILQLLRNYLQPTEDPEKVTNRMKTEEEEEAKEMRRYFGVL